MELNPTPLMNFFYALKNESRRRIIMKSLSQKSSCCLLKKNSGFKWKFCFRKILDNLNEA